MYILNNNTLIINSSYQPDGITYQCLQKICPNGEYVFLPDYTACLHCKDKRYSHAVCTIGHSQHPSIMDIIEKIKRYPKILIGSPVYCDFPSPKLLAFLSRLAVLSEGMKRKPFKNKWIYIHTNGFCSGTKSAAKIIMDACEMIGFKHKGRCISEYIELWKDNKIRGGF